jgi:hypothetical protein
MTASSQVEQNAIPLEGTPFYGQTHNEFYKIRLPAQVKHLNSSHVVQERSHS